MAIRSQPFFSVVVPVWKRAALARRAVESVLRQTFGDLEVIIVDDASPDPIEPLLGLPDDPRIRIIRREVNGGGSAARNTGLDAVRGRFVALLDSDDLWLPDKLAHEARWIERWNGAARWLLFSRFWIHASNGRTPSRELRWDPSCELAAFLFVERGPMQTSSLVMPAELAREVRFDESLRRLQDWDFVLRVARNGATIQHLPTFTAIHDVPESDNERISSRLDPDFLLRWIEERRNWMSIRAYRGFLANKVAPELVQVGRRAEAVPFLFQGMLHRVVHPRHALIELVRLGTPARVFSRILEGRKRARQRSGHTTDQSPT